MEEAENTYKKYFSSDRMLGAITGFLTIFLIFLFMI
jgi:hypothetical protein